MATARRTQHDESPDLPAIDPNSARLYAIIARQTRRAVVFRRGPTRKTCLLLWNLEDDTLVSGQWFIGRIYERRCDLSPDGRWLAYFAAKFRGPYRTWTAISRPPYLTALALWPKGDAWGGGGLFENGRRFQLNHRLDERKIAPVDDVTFLDRLAVDGLGDHAGWGEDEPILSQRLERDGWQTTETAWKEQPFGSRMMFVFNPARPRTRKLARRKAKPLLLRVLTHGYHERGGRTYVETADIVDEQGVIVRSFGRTDWIDLDHNGDVLLAREGKLERLRAGDIAGRAAPRVVADLNGMTFANVVAPSWATSWRRPSPI